MNEFTIKDLENLSGIRAHTIRIWEQRYSFLKPQRTQTNIRCYNNRELKSLLNIALLHKYGFKISQIDKMNEQELNEKIVGLSSAEAQQEKVTNELIRSMIDFNMDAFESVLDNYIMSRGLNKAITQIIFPFLDRIGVLWQTDHIHPVQEHLVTNIIRQKLIVGIEGVMSPVVINRTVVLFLPENEYHELGLLYIYYLLKNRGVKVIYIGANVPIEDIVYLCKLKKPDQLYTHLTCIAKNFNFEKFLTEMHRQLPDIPFTISGRLTQTNVRKIPPSINFRHSLSEVMEYILSL